MRATLSIAVAVVSLLAAACSSSHTGPLVNPPVTTQCLSVAPPVLVYPSPGATAVPSGSLQLWFYYAAPINFGEPFVSGGGSTFTGTPFVPPSPIPEPTGFPSPPPGTQAWVSTVSGLVSGVTYTVSVSNGCGSATLGSFVTR